MQYQAWRALQFAGRRLPPAVLYRVAGLAGAAAYWTWPRGRQSTRRNFGRVFGPGDARIRPAARRSLGNYCRYLVDFARLPTLDAAAVVASCDGDEEFAALDAVLARGAGAVFVCMHFGNWDMGAAAAAARGYPVTAVGEGFSDSRVTREVFAAREGLGATILPLERAGPSLIRVLKKNGLLALLIDRSVPGQGVPAQFFGATVEVPAGPAHLALRTGAALIPAAFPRVRADGPAVRVLADFSIDTRRTGDHDADVRRLTQQVMTAHEGFIRRYPAQWYKFRDMWETVGQA
jgi:KDO2-lipid IV(A) lauroyltransferase